MGDDRPIGIFDSGIGGLTVLEAAHRYAPNENYIYLGDTARLPYGAKSRETIIRYSIQNARRLVEHSRIKYLLVACNSASAWAIEELKRLNIAPTMGVIEPGVRAALALGSERESSSGRALGVIGTETTISSGAYERAIKAIDPTEEVICLACPLFVALAEEGWTDNLVARESARLYLSELRGRIDRLLLGCTHYPFLKPTLADFFGPGVQLIDSAEETARLLRERLESASLLNDQTGSGSTEVIVTDSLDRSRRMAERFFGERLKIDRWSLE